MAGPGVPAGVLHGARGAARDGAGRDAGGGGRAGAVGGLRGAGLLQVHGSQRRGGQGLLHGLRLRGRVRVRLPLLPRRRHVRDVQLGVAHFQRSKSHCSEYPMMAKMDMKILKNMFNMVSIWPMLNN